jgi:hypothetical protein
MPNRVLRPLLIAEFLIAVQVLTTFWSVVGGQYHLDLMFWPLKVGFILVSAWFIVAMTAVLARAPEGEKTPLPRVVWAYGILLLGTLTLAGVVTYYYHVNEPTDDEQDTQTEQPALLHHQTRHEFSPRTIG